MPLAGLRVVYEWRNLSEIAARNAFFDNPALSKGRVYMKLRESGPAFRVDHFGVYLQVEENE